jgi:hypothetical protein
MILGSIKCKDCNDIMIQGFQEGQITLMCHNCNPARCVFVEVEGEEGHS